MSTEKPTIDEAIAYLAAAFPVPSWEIETMRLYARELTDLNAGAVWEAAREWARTSSERPSLSELRTATVNMTNRIRNEKRRQLRLKREQDTGALERVDPAEARELVRGIIRQLEDRSSNIPALRIVR